MNQDAFRFMRLAVPGLACMTEIVIAMFFFHPEILSNAVKGVELKDSAATVVAAFVVTFVASGGLGYLLANAYFAIYWPTAKWIGIDHAPIFDALKKNARFHLFDLKGGSIDLEKKSLSRREAWMLAVQYMNSHRQDSNQMGGVEPHLTLLADIYRGVGTTFIGTIFSIVCYCLIVCRQRGVCGLGYKEVLAAAFWGLLLLALWTTYVYARDALARRMNSVIVQHIMDSLNDKEDREVTIYFQRD